MRASARPPKKSAKLDNKPSIHRQPTTLQDPFDHPFKNTIASPLVNRHTLHVIAQSEIRQLPLPEKLALLEAVWAELAADPDAVEIPQWHKDILDDRQQSMDQGSSQVLDWELAKEQISRIVQ